MSEKGISQNNARVIEDFVSTTDRLKADVSRNQNKWQELREFISYTGGDSEHLILEKMDELENDQ